MQYTRLFIGMAIGAVIGFVIGYFGKCATGTCPLTSNPVISTIIGALIGGILGVPK